MLQRFFSYTCTCTLLYGVQFHATCGQYSTVYFIGPLHEHLTKNNVEYLQFSFRWMNNLLMRELPLRCTIRLWDTYLVNLPFVYYHSLPDLRQASLCCGVSGAAMYNYTVRVSHHNMCDTVVLLEGSLGGCNFMGRLARIFENHKNDHFFCNACKARSVFLLSRCFNQLCLVIFSLNSKQ